MPSPRLSCIVLLALAGACHSKGDDAAATGVAQVETGTVSDAMLPLDKVTSEPPLAPESAADSSSSRGKAGPGGAPSAAPGDAVADTASDAATATAPADSGE